MSQGLNMHHRFLLVIVFMLFFAPPAIAQPPAIYYLDAVNGSDSNDGLTPNTAWKTIAKINEYDNQQKFVPGNQILFKSGQVFSQTERIEFNSSGNGSNLITFSSYGEGPAPILENTSDWQYSSVFWVAGNYISINNLTLRGAVEAGVDIRGDYIEVARLQIYDTGIGISIQGDHATVSENYIHDLKMIVSDSVPDNDYGAVAVLVSGNNAYITRNTLLNLKAPSIDYGFDGSAVEIYGAVDSVEVYANYAENCNDFMEVGSAERVTVSNVFYHRNLIVGCNSSSVLHIFGGNSNWGVDLVNFQFDSNTIVGNNHGFYLSGTPQPTTVYIRSNIFALNDLAQWGSSTFGDTVHEHNLYTSINNSAAVPNFALHPSEIVADPKFVSIGAKNYRLHGDSRQSIQVRGQADSAIMMAIQLSTRQILARLNTAWRIPVLSLSSTVVLKMISRQDGKRKARSSGSAISLRRTNTSP
jgi:hypothetical protein